MHSFPLQAASYYAQAKNSDALADALYRLEDFDGLEQLTAALPEGAPLLLHLGERFQSVGLCQQAANAYIKVSNASLCSCVWLFHLVPGTQCCCLLTLKQNLVAAAPSAALCR